MLHNHVERQTELRGLFEAACAAHPVLSQRRYEILVVCKANGFDKMRVRRYNREDSERVRAGSNQLVDSS